MRNKVIASDEFIVKEVKEACKGGKRLKETEIGLIPEGWEVKKLGEIAKVTSGGTPSRSKTEYWENGTIPWLKISDLKPFYVRDSEEKITEEGLKNSTAKIFPKGTILFTVFATLGDVAILDMDAATNQAISGIFINDENKVNKLYLAYYLKSLKDSWIKKSKGVTQRNINQTILKNTLVPIPPLPIQQKIVARLHAFFEHYNKLRKEKQLAKEKYDTILQSAIASLIPQKELPEGWEEKKLKEVITKTETKDPKKEPNKHFFYIDISSINKEKFLIENPQYILGKDAPSRARRLIKQNDVIFSTNRPNLRTISLIPKEYDNQICSTGFCVLRSSDRILPRFLFYLMMSDYVLDQINPKMRGIQYPAVSDSDVLDTTISLPSLEEQGIIVKKLDIVYQGKNNITEQQKNIDYQLEQLPKAVLSKAFRGELVS